jgi:hypothetical protein
LAASLTLAACALGCSSGNDSSASAPSTLSVDDEVELWWRRHRGEIETVDTAVADLRATAMFRSDPAALGQGCTDLAAAVAALRDGALPTPEPRLTEALDGWAAGLDGAVDQCTFLAADPTKREVAAALIAALDAVEDDAERTVTPVLDVYLHERG